MEIHGVMHEGRGKNQSTLLGCFTTCKLNPVCVFRQLEWITKKLHITTHNNYVTITMVCKT